MFQMADFDLNPALDVDAAASSFAQTGRAQLTDFLSPDSARSMLEILRSRNDWLQVVNSENKLFELSREVRREMAESTREALETAIYAGARKGFQFRYETVRVPDGPNARLESSDPLAALATFLSSDRLRDLFRLITDTPTIDFADAQATAFGPGDFLTAHDDAVPNKQRHAAYVLGLTPQWRPEWGGLLLFHDDRVVSHGFVPDFNTLNLFRVPQKHSVSEVTRAAPYRRYSVTGWLRSR